MISIDTVTCIDALKGLKKLKDKSVHCIVTSPPYWGLRDYGVDGQLGLEDTPKKYVRSLVKIFKESMRVLRDDGTLWLNLGDTYAASGRGGGGGSFQDKDKGTKVSNSNNKRKPPVGFKPKDLVGIPWMVAFALRDAGWYLRQDIIWSKPNPMPESVQDRCTKAHEYIFMLSKSNRYYYDADAIKTEAKYPGITGMDATGFKNTKSFNGKHSDKQRGHSRRHAGFNERWNNMTSKEQCSLGANKRSVWTVPTKPFKEAHFATFPPELIIDCIKAGCPENGVVLDMFNGSNTTGLVAKKLNRNFIGFELNPAYIAIGEKRLQKELGLFNI